VNHNSEVYKQRYRKLILTATIPVIGIYFVFMIFPLLQSLYYSLFNWSGFSKEMEFIAANNYLNLAKDGIFLRTLFNSIKYVFVGGIVIIGITLLFTYVISNFKSRKLRDIVQMILFVPNTISPVALALLWNFVLNTRWGLLNETLKTLGLGFLAKGWMGQDYIFYAALSLLVWINVGYFIVMYLAAVDRIPMSLYESAEIDGATSWNKFTKITVPLIKDVIETSMVLWSIFSFKIFGYLFVFGAGGAGSDPALEIRNIAVQIYLTGFGKRTPINKLGYASAMAILLLFFVALLVYLIRKLVFTEVVEY
jgi:ABC-type sugar transport system permease subunit